MEKMATLNNDLVKYLKKIECQSKRRNKRGRKCKKRLQRFNKFFF